MSDPHCTCHRMSGGKLCPGCLDTMSPQARARFRRPLRDEHCTCHRTEELCSHCQHQHRAALGNPQRLIDVPLNSSLCPVCCQESMEEDRAGCCSQCGADLSKVTSDRLRAARRRLMDYGERVKAAALRSTEPPRQTHTSHCEARLRYGDGECECGAVHGPMHQMLRKAERPLAERCKEFAEEAEEGWSTGRAGRSWKLVHQLSLLTTELAADSAALRSEVERLRKDTHGDGR